MTILALSSFSYKNTLVGMPTNIWYSMEDIGVIIEVVKMQLHLSSVLVG